jgi:hypothetical protein
MNLILGISLLIGAIILAFLVENNNSGLAVNTFICYIALAIAYGAGNNSKHKQ